MANLGALRQRDISDERWKAIADHTAEATPEEVAWLLEVSAERERALRRELAAWRDGFATGLEAGRQEGYERSESERESAWKRMARPFARPEVHAREQAARNVRAAEAECRRDADEQERAFTARARATPELLRTESQQGALRVFPGRARDHLRVVGQVAGD